MSENHKSKSRIVCLAMIGLILRVLGLVFLSGYIFYRLPYVGWDNFVIGLLPLLWLRNPMRHLDCKCSGGCAGCREKEKEERKQ